MDRIIRAVTGDGNAKISVISARDSVERAREIHDCSPTAAAALGRLLCAVSMLGELLKEDDASVTIRVNGGGGLGSLIVVSDSGGNMRGWVQHPEFDLPTRQDGKLDVGGAVGRDGMFTVSRDLGLREPYIGSTELVSGEIAEDLAKYLIESEQVGAAAALGVLIGTDKSVRAAGGFIVQLLPSAPDDTVLALEANIAALGSVSAILDNGTPEEIINLVFNGLSPRILEEISVEYRCQCTRERVAQALTSVGADGLREMISAEYASTVSCQFCDAIYEFSTTDLEAFLLELEAGERED